MENTLLEQLKPIFPNLTEEVILLSIRHPSNNTQPGSSQEIFLSCIDDLLQLRTFSENSAKPQKKDLSSDGKYWQLLTTPEINVQVMWIELRHWCDYLPGIHLNEGTSY